MSEIKYIDEDATFTIERPENYTGLYFPLAGEKGLKSSITPNLGGDSKIDQTSFLLEPVSIENLHNNRSTRNFWVISRSLASGKKDIWSATGASAEAENNRFTENQDDSSVTAGFMWHELLRKSKKYGLSAEIRSFIPVHENVEVMQVNIKNDSGEVTPSISRGVGYIREFLSISEMMEEAYTITLPGPQAGLCSLWLQRFTELREYTVTCVLNRSSFLHNLTVKIRLTLILFSLVRGCTSFM